MSRGYSSWTVWSSIGSSRSSRSSRASWCSSKSDVECVSDMLRVLVLHARGRFIISSRYKGARDDLCGHHQGLSRHSAATACVMPCGGFLLVVPFSVWASQATCFNNCRCASDLLINRVRGLIFGVWVGGHWVHFNLVSLMIGLS